MICDHSDHDLNIRCKTVNCLLLIILRSTNLNVENEIHNLKGISKNKQCGATDIQFDQKHVLSQSVPKNSSRNKRPS